MSVQVGIRVCWGVRDEWVSAPIVNLPKGAVVVKRKFRKHEIGTAYVRFNGEVSCWILVPAEGGISLYAKVAVNLR